MVVQVVADRQVGDHVDAVLAQVAGRADAGQHQQLRRAEDAGAEDDLAVGPDRLPPGRGDDLNPDRAVTSLFMRGSAGCGYSPRRASAGIIFDGDEGRLSEEAFSVLAGFCR